MLHFSIPMAQNIRICPVSRTAKLKISCIASLTSRLHAHGFANSSAKASTDGRDAGLKRSRGFKVSESAMKLGSHQAKLPMNAVPLARYLAGTILIPDPSRVEKADVIKNLPRLFFPFQRPLRKVTFFITPEFVHWLDRDDFIQDALNHMYRGWLAASRNVREFQLGNGHKYNVQSRVAVVDRLPFATGKGSGCPGISVAVTPWGRRWLSHREVAEKSAPVEQEPRVPHISVTVPFSNERDEMKNVKIFLRPANTIFVNGRQSTMFLEEWVFDKDAAGWPEFLKEGGREDLDQFPLKHQAQSSSLSVPLQKLTKRRTIALCMGNIISKLVGERDAEPISASLELEEQVSAFMKRKDATNGTLFVFALITPKLRNENESTEDPAVPADFLGHHKDKAVESNNVDTENERTLDHIRLAIFKGGHLHRVTSGGGGWGKKQGLLSLEPAMDLDSGEPNLASPFELQNPEEPDDGESAWNQAATPEIIRLGDQVEFYATFLSKEEDQFLIRRENTVAPLNVPNTKLWQVSNWAEEDKSSIIWGVIPPKDSYGTDTAAGPLDKLITIPHQFGMLSENGLVLQKVDRDIINRTPADIAINGRRKTNITRIDVPRTVLTYSVSNRKVSEDFYWKKVNNTSAEDMIHQIDLQAAREDGVEFLRGRKAKHHPPAAKEVIPNDILEETEIEKHPSTADRQDAGTSPAGETEFGIRPEAELGARVTNLEDQRTESAPASDVPTLRITKHKYGWSPADIHQQETASPFAGQAFSEHDHQATSPARSTESRRQRPERKRRAKNVRGPDVPIVKYRAPLLIRKHNAGR